MLLMLPLAIYAYVQKLTALDRALAWHYAVLPLAGCLVAIGYWVLPVATRGALFVLGEMPPGRLAMFLAIESLALIVIWIPVYRCRNCRATWVRRPMRYRKP